MSIGSEKMAKQRTRRTLALAGAVAGVLWGAVAPVSADTLTWDTSNTVGVQTGGGTWDFNSSANWIPEGADGTSRTVWTSNADTASFLNLGNVTVSISGANGQVGAAGLSFSGTGTANTFSLDGDSLQLGSGGVTSTVSNHVISIGAALSLTNSQTWTSATLRSNSNGPAVRAAGNVSSISGTTNLAFDGLGVSNPAATGNSSLRTSFSLAGSNSFSGTTTVTGGAALWLDYVTSGDSKLDDTRALFFDGGSIILNGGSNVVEVVASTTVSGGANTIYNGFNGAGGAVNRLQLGAISRVAGNGGTLDFSNASAGLASTTSQNTNGILGGWATHASGTRWAVGSATGADTNIAQTAGSGRAASSTWGTTDNVNVTASESNIASKTINSLRINDSNEFVNFAPGSTLHIASGGILAGNSGQSITGGQITTGVGELFIHTPNAFTVGSVIADNGTTPATLVKAGSNNLTLTGDNTYSGQTFVNSGTLLLDNGGSLANSNITIHGAAILAGGTTGDRGTLNFQIDNDLSDLITIAGGTLDLTNLRFELLLSGNQSLGEYVVADKAVGSASVLGTSFLSTSLPAGWSIDYDGTLAHPQSIVLTAPVPEPSALALTGLLATGLIARRRRRA